MAYVISPPPIPTLPVDGSSDQFPVGRIFCVGRNYADHAREMGHDPSREPPFFFVKPGSAILPEGRDFPYPPLTQNVHYEFELVAAIGTGGANIRAADALQHIYGYAVGLDMTRRDLQDQAKALRRPWEAAKAFDHSAPCSRVVPAGRIGHPDRGAIWLDVNGSECNAPIFQRSSGKSRKSSPSFRRFSHLRPATWSSPALPPASAPCSAVIRCTAASKAWPS